MCIFYNLTGKCISKEVFIQSYSYIYYFKNNFATENNIEYLYNKQEKTADDYIEFLRWKVGDRKDSGDITTQYGNKIDTKGIVQIFNELNQPNQIDRHSQVETIYKKIISQNVTNIGSVYALALLSFFTGGQEPIYDKFADIALSAISDNQHGFRTPIKHKELPDKNNIDGVMGRYKCYKQRLTGLFGDSWKINRDVDRALWTYGHLFR